MSKIVNDNNNNTSKMVMRLTVMITKRKKNDRRKSEKKRNITYLSNFIYGSISLPRLVSLAILFSTYTCLSRLPFLLGLLFSLQVHHVPYVFPPSPTCVFPPLLKPLWKFPHFTLTFCFFPFLWTLAFHHPRNFFPSLLFPRPLHVAPRHCGHFFFPQLFPFSPFSYVSRPHIA